MRSRKCMHMQARREGGRCFVCCSRDSWFWVGTMMSGRKAAARKLTQKERSRFAFCLCSFEVEHSEGFLR